MIEKQDLAFRGERSQIAMLFLPLRSWGELGEMDCPLMGYLIRPITAKNERVMARETFLLDCKLKIL